MLNMYMGFSRGYGPREGALLIFANTAREARSFGWQNGGTLFTDDYLDFAVRRIRDADWLYQDGNCEKLENNIPHTNDSPRACDACFCWGQSPIGEDGLCEDCRQEREDHARRLEELETTP